MGEVTRFPTKRPDPLAFDRAISEDQVNDWERAERECFGITRRIALMTLARSRHELAEGFADDKAGLYEIADQIEAWQDRLKASLELADAAYTRLYIVSGDCPHCPDPTAAMEPLAGDDLDTVKAIWAADDIRGWMRRTKKDHAFNESPPSPRL